MTSTSFSTCPRCLGSSTLAALVKRSPKASGSGTARLLAAASKPALANGIAGLLAFAEKLHIGHDRLVRMDGLPMLDVCFIIGNADHQPRRSRRPIDGCARSARGSIEQVLQVRHCDLLRLRRQARFPRRSPAGCRELSRY